MAETIDEITVNYEMDGELLVEELDKVVLTKGVWSTILFRYREKNAKTGEYGLPKATLRRFNKSKGVYRKRDAVNLTAASATQLIEILNDWLKKGLLE
jgi:hypothetical protein